MMTLPAFLILSALLFCVGLAAVLIRRNAILILIGIELMLSAANINFVAFWRFGENSERLDGMIFVLFSIAIAAAEAAVGLALIIAIYRHYRSVDPAEYRALHG